MIFYGWIRKDEEKTKNQSPYAFPFYFSSQPVTSLRPSGGRHQNPHSAIAASTCRFILEADQLPSLMLSYKWIRLLLSLCSLPLLHSPLQTICHSSQLFPALSQDNPVSFYQIYSLRLSHLFPSSCTWGNRGSTSPRGSTAGWDHRQIQSHQHLEF